MFCTILFFRCWENATHELILYHKIRLFQRDASRKWKSDAPEINVRSRLVLERKVFIFFGQ